MNVQSILICTFKVALFSMLVVSSVNAEGVTDNKIVLGQSAALTGPAGELGTGLHAGLQAAFSEANAAGGIYGRQIELIVKDDGYEPDRAIANSRALIESEKVFMLIGEVGTPTSMAVVPITEKFSVPFFGAFTGAEFLRSPFKANVVNVRASYYQEMEHYAKKLVDDKGMTKIACFYQNDGYGQAGLKGIELALEKRGMTLVATGMYERNTTAVKSGLLKIRKVNPEAIVMVGAYKPCAKFIKLAKKIGMNEVVFCNISFVGTEALKNELGESGEGVIISQVVRFPWDISVPLVDEYQKAMRKYQPEEKVDFLSLEGYMVGKLFVMIAQEAGEGLTRESFLQAIQRVKLFELGGVTLTYGENDHQGMDEVYLTIIKGDKIQQY